MAEADPLRSASLSQRLFGSASVKAPAALSSGGDVTAALTAPPSEASAPTDSPHVPLAFSPQGRLSEEAKAADAKMREQQPGSRRPRGLQMRASRDHSQSGSGKATANGAGALPGGEADAAGADGADADVALSRRHTSPPLRQVRGSLEPDAQLRVLKELLTPPPADGSGPTYSPHGTDMFGLKVLISDTPPPRLRFQTGRAWLENGVDDAVLHYVLRPPFGVPLPARAATVHSFDLSRIFRVRDEVDEESGLAYLLLQSNGGDERLRIGAFEGRLHRIGRRLSGSTGVLQRQTLLSDGFRALLLLQIQEDNERQRLEAMWRMRLIVDHKRWGSERPLLEYNWSAEAARGALAELIDSLVVPVRGSGVYTEDAIRAARRVKRRHATHFLALRGALHLCDAADIWGAEDDGVARQVLQAARAVVAAVGGGGAVDALVDAGIIEVAADLLGAHPRAHRVGLAGVAFFNQVLCSAAENALSVAERMRRAGAERAVSALLSKWPTDAQLEQACEEFLRNIAQKPRSPSRSDASRKSAAQEKRSAIAGMHPAVAQAKDGTIKDRVLQGRTRSKS